jgi:hypothetical protein
LSHEQLAKTSVDVHQRKLEHTTSDQPRPAHNPKVEGSNPSPATNGFSESSRKPTISWAFVLFRRTSTGLSTSLSGLFIGTYSTPAYAAYARVRGPSGPYAAPFVAEAQAEEAMHRAALCMPYACALLNLLAAFKGGTQGQGLLTAPVTPQSRNCPRAGPTDIPDFSPAHLS